MFPVIQRFSWLWVISLPAAIPPFRSIQGIQEMGISPTGHTTGKFDFNTSDVSGGNNGQPIAPNVKHAPQKLLGQGQSLNLVNSGIKNEPNIIDVTEQGKETEAPKPTKTGSPVGGEEKPSFFTRPGSNCWQGFKACIQGIRNAFSSLPAKIADLFRSKEKPVPNEEVVVNPENTDTDVNSENVTNLESVPKEIKIEFDNMIDQRRFDVCFREMLIISRG